MFFALVLPMVLLPAAAYAVDSAVVVARRASLQASTAEAAEIVAQQIDVNMLRSAGALRVDPSQISGALAVLASEEPGSRVESSAVSGATVTLVTEENVGLPLPLFGRTVTIRARATARLTPGYDRPSSRLPFSTSTF